MWFDACTLRLISYSVVLGAVVCFGFFLQCSFMVSGTGGMVSILMTTFGKLGPSAEACLQNLADVACCTDVVNCGLWLGITKQLPSCSLVWGHRVVFRHYYKGFFPTEKVSKGANPRITRLFLKALETMFVMLLLCPSNDCGCFNAFS